MKAIFALVLSLALAAAAQESPKPKAPVADPVLDALLGGKPVSPKPQAPKPEDPKPENPGPEDPKTLDLPDPTLDQLLERMNHNRQKVKKLESSLTRGRLAPLISETPDIHKGVMKFESPRFLFMELKGPQSAKPEDQRLNRTIVTEDFAYLWRVDENEAERYKLPPIDERTMSERNPLEYGLAADIRNLRKDYYLTLMNPAKVNGRPASTLRARPRPHLKDAPCTQIIFWIDNELLIPVQIEQTKSDGEIIDTYTLDEVKLNPWWWTSPFKPPPSSVNLIRHDLAEEKK